MDFLYSLNRLNVATSRARCPVILVASPKLFDVSCRSVEQVRLASAFCKYVESENRPGSYVVGCNQATARRRNPLAVNSR